MDRYPLLHSTIEQARNIRATVSDASLRKAMGDLDRIGASELGGAVWAALGKEELALDATVENMAPIADIATAAGRTVVLLIPLLRMCLFPFYFGHKLHKSSGYQIGLGRGRVG